MSRIHVADTGFLVALGGPTNEKFRSARAFARRHDVTFVVPDAVHDELSATGPGTAVDEDRVGLADAVQQGWVSRAEPLTYDDPLVSQTVDGVRRYVARVDGRPEDRVERADAALGGVAMRAIRSGRATSAAVYTTDVAAGQAIEAVFADRGYGDAVTWVDGFAFVDDL